MGRPRVCYKVTQVRSGCQLEIERQATTVSGSITPRVLSTTRMSPPPIIHDISFNHPYHPRPFTTLEKQIEIYVTLQHEICYDYRDQPASQPIYDYATELFKALTPQKLKRGVDLRLAPFMFELCLRCAMIHLDVGGYEEGESSTQTCNSTEASLSRCPTTLAVP